jgi:hypothetical protein
VMRWDMGINGLGLLAATSLAFGLIAHLIVGKGLTRWLWLLSAIAYFLAWSGGKNAKDRWGRPPAESPVDREGGVTGAPGLVT